MRQRADGRSIPPSPLVIFIHGAGQDHTNWQLPARWFAWHGHSVLGARPAGPRPLGRTAAGNDPRHGAVDRPPDGCRQRQARRARRPLHGRRDRRGGRGGHCPIASRASPCSARRCDAGQRRPAHRRARCARASAPDDHRAGRTGPRAKIGGNPAPGLWMSGGTMALLGRNRPGTLHAAFDACNRWKIRARGRPARALPGARRDRRQRLHDAAQDRPRARRQDRRQPHRRSFPTAAT